MSTRDSKSVAVRLLQLVLRDRAEGRSRSVADYQALFPAHRELVAAELAALDEPAGGPLAGDGCDADYPGRGERYAGREEVARGGMGRVLRVFDPALERTVAMKVLGDAGRDLPAAALLRRFLHEAKVTGRLAHPGIVAVHEIGLDRDRRPYFTMPLIEGQSLQEIIAAVHAGDPEWSLVRGLDVLVRVCDAVAYAHQRGVVHRDLKPSNVMVGRFGETYVVDWGLARALDRPDERDIRLRSDDDLDAAESALCTVEGDVVGTPAYMAPEQARGELERVGKRSDVYSIGAMLYHLIAGAAPYGGPGARSTGRETLRALLAGPPAPLAAGRAAPELAAICARAMAREPEQRYPDVGGLGRDLRAFLENRVVAAYATGPVAELRQWTRRNRGLAIASGAAALALVVGLVASLALKHSADRHAARAEENFELAFEAAEDLLGEVGISDLANEPGADPLRGALVHRALEYHRRFQELRGDDPEVADKVALSLFRIASLEAGLGHAEAAARSLRAARDAHLSLIASAGPSPALLRRLSAIEGELGVIDHEQGRVAEAIVRLRQAWERIEGLLATEPESADLLRDGDTILGNLSAALRKHGEPERALACCDDRLGVTERLVAVSPNAPIAHEKAGSAHEHRAMVLWGMRRMDEAEAGFRAAVTALERGLAEHEDHRGLRFRLCDTLNILAVVQRQQGQLEPARATLRRAVDGLRALTAEFPGVRNYHGHLGGALCNLAVLIRVEDPEQALALYEEARDQVRRALAIDPDHVDYRNFRRIVGTEHSKQLVIMGRHADAAACVEELVDAQPGEHDLLAAERFAQCLILCGRDSALESGRRRELADGYAERAMRHLRAAAGRGSLEADALREPPFDALAGRDDYQTLLARVGG